MLQSCICCVICCNIICLCFPPWLYTWLGFTHFLINIYYAVLFYTSYVIVILYVLFLNNTCLCSIPTMFIYVVRVYSFILFCNTRFNPSFASLLPIGSYCHILLTCYLYCKLPPWRECYWSLLLYVLPLHYVTCIIFV